MSWRFRLVTFLMSANSFCGQKDCYCVPRWVHGQMMFTQLQRNYAKIFLPNNGFQLVLVFLQEQPDRLFHICIWLLKYLHAIMGNSVSPCAPEAAEQHLNGMCTASWCEMSSAESKGKGTCSNTDLPWPCSVCIRRSQMPKAARKEMLHSQKFSYKNNKQNKKSKLPCLYDSLWLRHSSLNGKHILHKRRQEQESDLEGSFWQSLGSRFIHRVGQPEPQLQMYHFLTNNRLTLLMSPKETPSQLWLKGDSTPHITT